MIPWWLVALLVTKARRTGRRVDTDLQREIEIVSARITARYQEFTTRERALTLMERQRIEESGKLPVDLEAMKRALIDDYLLLNKLMTQQYRRAGGEIRLPTRRVEGV